MGEYQNYWLPTLIAALAIVLDLFVNQSFVSKDFITCIIDVPREILLLSMGFVVTYTATSTDDNHSTTGTVMLVGSFILSVIVYALCRNSSHIYSSLANSTQSETIKVGIRLVISILVSLILSIGFYYSSITVCLGGKTL